MKIKSVSIVGKNFDTSRCDDVGIHEISIQDENAEIIVYADTGVHKRSLFSLLQSTGGLYDDNKSG